MIEYYRNLLDDPIRLSLVEKLFGQTIRHGDTVADIGCGLGTFAMLAARLGAKSVVAVDHGPVITVAKELAKANQLAERIEFFRGWSHEVKPPRRSRVVYFEDYPIPLISPAAHRTVKDIVGRWLAPRGVLIPSHGEIWAAPVEAVARHSDLDRFRATEDKLFGLDFSRTRQRMFATPSNSWFEPQVLAAAATRLQTVSFRAWRRPVLKASWKVKATRATAIHGLLMWADLRFGKVWLRSGPLDPKSAWRQQFFPFAAPLRVRAGEALQLSLDGSPFGDDMVWRWRARSEAGARDQDSLLHAQLGVMRKSKQ